MPSSVINTSERQPLPLDLQTNTSSSASSSTITLQRSRSIGSEQSVVRPPAAPQNRQASPHVSKATANFSKPVTSPESKRRPSNPHSRSNSIGGVRDGAGNLNRWSESTTSSKGSPRQATSNSFSRRMSFGGPGPFNFGVPNTQSTNKLQKSRPPTAEGLSRHPPTARLFDSASNPALSLPPIVTLPAFQQSSNDKPSPLTAGTTTPSTAGLLSAAVRQAVPDYFTLTGDDSTPRESAQLKASLQGRPQIDSNQSSGTLASQSFSGTSPVRRQREEGENGLSRGHSRNRSQAGKDSSGTTSSDKSRSSKQPSQKAMLSKALQKANTAVLLDNAQNFEGAMQAYSEACNLLQQVMVRSSGDEDKRKLEAIRNTYTSRIAELEKITPSLRDVDGKALPARPSSNDYKDEDDMRSPIEDDDNAVVETATMARIVNDDSYVTEPQSRQILNSQLPQRRESLLHAAFEPAPYKLSRNLAEQYYPPRSYSKSPMREKITETTINLAPPMDREYMPPPLSPRRPQSPTNQSVVRSDTEKQRSDAAQPTSNLNNSPGKAHRRAASTESMSWLDTIDESAGSTSSSVRSRSSSLGLRGKHIRDTSGATEAEFDAALDAAVEAAYDDGFEPADEPGPLPEIIDYDEEIVANVRRRVELAKERVRETEREAAIQYARDREKSRLLRKTQSRPESMEAEYNENESEEEERMLEEMTRGYVMDDFEFGLQSKSALPRESDSSGFSGRTWNSSIGSNPTTAGTSLSTVIEKAAIPEMPQLQSKTPPLSHPPPVQALPQPPMPPLSTTKVVSAQPTNPLPPPSVRSRRLSGQNNPKQLKIETTTRSPPGPVTQPPVMPPPQIPYVSQPPHTASATSQSRQPPSATSMRPPLPPATRQASSPFPGPSISDALPPPTPTLTQAFTQESDTGIPRSGSPGRAQSRSGLRKNFSSSSLKNMKNRNLSVSNLDDGSDFSPNTPMSNQFGNSLSGKDSATRIPAMPTLPTPMATAFRDRMNGAPTGGLYLFQSDINSPETPGSPGLGGSAPIPLEHCPTEFLLRPFWLMRALYQTIAHPRGGYLSTKLFVPRDVWRVKGVKIKNLEDKISNCDFLTAALQKLAQVDTYDADAVLEEMQALESVLDQVQATLNKKLGSEVGTQGSGILFKDASTPNEAESGSIGSKNASVASKSSFSWRRLRSKNSGVGLTNNYAGKPALTDGPKESLTMSTLPMTSLSTTRFAKRDVNSVRFEGPNANYMGALARLFDAAQVIDEIARQVEDPGLRHADKTQVGLELSTRHAAEFFGFYICRFVLADVSLLLDKFIKRGSEWVLV